MNPITRLWLRRNVFQRSSQRQHLISRYSKLNRLWSDSLPSPPNKLLLYSASGLVLSLGTSFAAYQSYDGVRHSYLAIVRCSRVAEAVILGAIDYKKTFAKTYHQEQDRQEAYSNCHTRSAKRVLKALLANGGIFIKLGQHISSLVVLPVEWTRTMRPLQDQCDPTPYEDVEALFLSDIGKPISELFDEFDPKPLGVASLAQVHLARHHDTGKEVAVKLQHPHLAEFCDIDMEMVDLSLGWVKYWFPDFEFSWLGEEMRENLPKEMDFVHEANNAARAEKDFEGIRSSLYIPKVITASKRVLIMEYIQGGRVDDLSYLAEHNIDRNKVALELQRIFCQMVHLNGWFHADPHPGNILIRPAQRLSKSPYNFEVVLLDHGLYFDIDDSLRINYSKLWLSLIAEASPTVNADRRKYAELVGNIGPDLYPVFESAITGRAGLEGTWEEGEATPLKRPSSMVDMMPQSEQEMEAIRNAVIQREGLLVSVFDLLRRVPRRVLMVLKLNDLTRGLDHALATTHSSSRIFLITARYCSLAVWRDDRRRLIDEMKEKGLLSWSVVREYFERWWSFQKTYQGLHVVEAFMDLHGWMVMTKAWMRGLVTHGLYGAHLAACGLA
ncbi:ABC1-domain-containing protein [Rickenella mellea]|uniref:ABC1-domain-containing protein n=1 Tax=Rickenella mellea TaxID=50990 RepID=A0A4Y7QHF1_9AGAM|nr:ABC1-domain-containing protein [Rickenella mellea]